MDGFSTELKYSLCFLNDARSIVITSFSSRKSISHLDIQIIQQSLYYQRRKRFLLKKSFFCTEESLRNHLVPKRRLLYTLNLDFDVRREYSNLKNGSVPHSLFYSYESLFVAVRGHDGFFKYALAWLIKEACLQGDSKLKLLKWMVAFRPLESISIPLRVQDSCVMVLYRECVDPEFVKEFFVRFMKLGVFLLRRDLKNLDYVLFHARLCNFGERSEMSCRSSMTDHCIKYHCFRPVPSVLKYEDTVYYTENSYEVYKKITFENSG
ncbi:hypothetical protein AVEN_267584-1, partial [Araneus ventricosus]